MPTTLRVDERVALINRIFSQALVKVQRVTPVQIRDYGEEKLSLGNPYGVLPFAATATPENLMAAIEWCRAEKIAWLKRGDTFRSNLFSKRERLFQGLLHHTVEFGLA